MKGQDVLFKLNFSHWNVFLQFHFGLEMTLSLARYPWIIINKTLLRPYMIVMSFHGGFSIWNKCLGILFWTRNKQLVDKIPTNSQQQNIDKVLKDHHVLSKLIFSIAFIVFWFHFGFEMPLLLTRYPFTQTIGPQIVIKTNLRCVQNIIKHFLINKRVFSKFSIIFWKPSESASCIFLKNFEENGANFKVWRMLDYTCSLTRGGFQIF